MLKGSCCRLIGVEIDVDELILALPDQTASRVANKHHRSKCSVVEVLRTVRIVCKTTQINSEEVQSAALTLSHANDFVVVAVEVDISHAEIKGRHVDDPLDSAESVVDVVKEALVYACRFYASSDDDVVRVGVDVEDGTLGLIDVFVPAKDCFVVVRAASCQSCSYKNTLQKEQKTCHFYCQGISVALN